MSTTPPPAPDDDPLARAEAALWQAPIPEGPSEMAIARTLAALEAAGGSGSPPQRRSKTMLAMIKIAAAALAAATAGLLYSSSSANAGFAEAAQKLRDAHTLIYRMTMEAPGAKQAPAMRVSFKEPGSFRAEVEGGGLISISDAGEGKQLMLDPKAKTAILLEGKALKTSPNPAIGLVEHLKQLTRKDAKPAGEREIGGVRAPGYLVERLGSELTIWIDPQTRLPLRVESATKAQGQEFRAILTDFRLDAEIDDALFNLEPPEGYAVRKMESDAFSMDEKAFADPEKAAAGLLRAFAEKADGRFPKRLDDFSEFDEVFPKPEKAGILPDPETLKAVQSLTRFIMATRPLKGNFGYRPEGVKLGDADKILFWYTPAGATRPRALYGDLHAADVDADQLPKP